MTTTLPDTQTASAFVASVNGIALHQPGDTPDIETLRQRACLELLRQAAQASGLLGLDDTPHTDGAISETANDAIEVLLDDALRQPEPSDEACQRYFEANQARFRTGERVRCRHILFAVTPGVDVTALRKRAEGTLLDVRCHDGSAQGGFAKAAQTLSNCPSGATGGDLGWLTNAECAPEFAREVFGHVEIGVLPRLVLTRFGIHVVEVQERDPGSDQDFDRVRGAVRATLARQSHATALRQYVQILAGAANLTGVDLEGADSPLLQ